MKATGWALDCPCCEPTRSPSYKTAYQNCRRHHPVDRRLAHTHSLPVAFLARDLTLDAERKSPRFGVAALIEERGEGR
jgi:hypothetical protein